MKLLPALILISSAAIAKPAVRPAPFVAGTYDPDAPSDFSVSEVSNDGHVIHNRVTFSCRSTARKQIACVMVQQDLQEPTAPPSKDELDKAIAEIRRKGDVLDQCKSSNQFLTKSELQRVTSDDRAWLSTLEVKFKKACEAKDREALLSVLRESLARESQTCTLYSVIFHYTFTEVSKGTWVSKYDGPCDNVALTRTIQRVPGLVPASPAWNYTEVTVARPANPRSGFADLCQQVSGATKFTWERAFTGSELRCRYVEM